MFLAVLALYLPASWFASLLPPQVRCASLGGSVWHGECLGLTFEGGKTESFSINNKALAEGALAELRGQRAAISEAVKERNIDVIMSLDPFFEVRVADAWENPPPDKSFDQGPLAGRQ